MVRLESGKELKVKPDNAAFEDAADEPLAAMEAAMAAASQSSLLTKAASCGNTASYGNRETAAMSTAGAGAAPGGFTCAVCYEDYGADKRAVLPCCGKVESTVQYCKRCIEIIVEQGFGGTVGRCPTCSQLITIQGGVITGGHIVASCRMCMQERPIADSRSVLCEMCVLGRSFTMRYECERCHCIQRIPHPMWRYQEEGATSFGTNSWAHILKSAPYRKFILNNYQGIDFSEILLGLPPRLLRLHKVAHSGRGRAQDPAGALPGILGPPRRVVGNHP